MVTIVKNVYQLKQGLQDIYILKVTEKENSESLSRVETQD